MMLHVMPLSPTEAGYMTLTKAAKEAIGLKGLAIESGFELKIVAGIATGSLSNAIPGPRFQHSSDSALFASGFVLGFCNSLEHQFCWLLERQSENLEVFHGM
ncbi:hypothetical protein Tco_1393846 [Tanacetum coccineum]